MQQPTDRVMPTLGLCLKTYLLVKQLKPGTEKAYRQKIETNLVDWLDVEMSAITPAMVLEKHQEISKYGECQADYVFRILRSLYRFAPIYFRLQGTMENPVLMLNACARWNVKGFRSRRDDYIDKTEFPQWFTAISSLKTDHQDLLLFLVLTGFRLNEACLLRWEDVCLETGVVTIGWDPARATKTNKTYRLPMSDYLWKMLRRRREATKADWVFTTKSSNTPFQSPYRMIKYVTDVTGIPFSPHDLRRTFINLASIKELNLNEATLKALLNHTVGTTATYYLTVDEDRLRSAMQGITNAFFRHAQADPQQYDADLRDQSNSEQKRLAKRNRNKCAPLAVAAPTAIVQDTAPSTPLPAQRLSDTISITTSAVMPPPPVVQQAASDPSTRLYLNTEEAVLRSGMSYVWHYERRRAGDGPPFLKVRQKVLYPIDAYDQWFALRKQQCTADYSNKSEVTESHE